MRLSVGDQIELQIDRLSYEGGRGVGRHEGFVVFVPDTAPGERIRATVSSVKKNFAEASLNEILVPSVARREPPCPVAQRCGGCVWQHVSYAEQLRQKRGMIEFSLKRVLSPGMTVPEVTPSPQEFRYRDRVQVHVRAQGESVEYGFFAKKSNDIVAINDCLITDARLFRELDPVLRSLPSLANSSRPAKAELVLDHQGQRQVRDLAKEESVFRQVNPAQNRHMVAAITEAVALHAPAPTEIFDLYCGDGNLTFPLAERFSSADVIGVEYSTSAIARAQKELAHHPGRLGERKIDFIAGDVAQIVRDRKPRARRAIIVDPPRAGLSTEVTQALLRLKPDLLVYVSCSLPTLARDLQLLCADSYRVVSVQGFDMFPQTEYVETVCVLLPRAN